MVFKDRTDAGRRLAGVLPPLDQPVVLGLPRGGVIVGAPVAETLGCPLDMIVVRKLGAPFQPELGIGAIAEHGVRVLNEELVERLRLSEQDLAAVEQAERRELARRVELYRSSRAECDLRGKTGLVIDDGLATGFTAWAAILAARAREATRVVLAVPVGAADTIALLAEVADEVVSVASPRSFQAVGFWYRNFRQTTDAEVASALRAARAH